MRSIREIAAKQGLASNVERVHLPTKHLYDGPKPDGKRCEVCQRLFGNPAEYVTCRLCGVAVCRRKGTCKGVHSSSHRIAAKRAQKGQAA